MEDATETDLAAVLRAHGHRVTRPRLAVWATLQEGGGHLTAEEVTARTRAAGSEIDVASVYRTLDLLEELGLVRSSRLGDVDASRWELAHPDEHFHLVCTVCGAVDHHVGSLVAQIREHLDQGHGFGVDEVELTVRGRCARCR
ncbi:MAG: Fur family transcriptional regulator [Nitriliruptoraceae bacterium]